MHISYDDRRGDRPSRPSWLLPGGFLSFCVGVSSSEAYENSNDLDEVRLSVARRAARNSSCCTVREIARLTVASTMLIKLFPPDSGLDSSRGRLRGARSSCANAAVYMLELVI